jgi:hypothetical protein
LWIFDWGWDSWGGFLRFLDRGHHGWGGRELWGLFFMGLCICRVNHLGRLIRNLYRWLVFSFVLIGGLYLLVWGDFVFVFILMIIYY